MSLNQPGSRSQADIHAGTRSSSSSPDLTVPSNARASPPPDDEAGAASPLLSQAASAHCQTLQSASPPQNLAVDSNSSSAGSATSSIPKSSVVGVKEKSWLRIWTWELLAAIFSMLCIGAVIGILIYMDGKLLDDWKFSISPNSLVSVFMTLAKSAMLIIVAESIGQLKWPYFQEEAHPVHDLLVFDEASRGPWGATKLIYRVRWHAIAASAGALLTVIALAMDPFTQQVIGTQSTLQNATGVAAQIRNARIWDYGGWDADVVSQMNMTAATFAGLFQSTTNVEFTCGSGNCTWTNFYSLGICHECRNITDEVVPECKMGGPGNATQLCDFTSDNLTIQTWSRGDQGPLGDIGYNQTKLNMTTHERDRYTVDLNMNANLSHLLVVYVPGTATSSKLGRVETYGCDFSLCRRQHAVSVTNAVLKETLVETKQLVFPNCSFGEDLCPGFPSDADIPSDYEAANQSALLSDPSTVWVSSNTQFSWRVWFDSVLRLAAFSVTSTSFDTIYGSDSALPNMMWYANAGNITQTIDDIMAAISRSIRQGPNTTWIEGTAQLPATMVRVRWQWISLPLLLVLFSVILLGVTIWSSLETGRVVWKSSILATFFHGLEGWEVNELDSRRDLHEMERTAKSMSVSLRSGYDGALLLRRVNAMNVPAERTL